MQIVKSLLFVSCICSGGLLAQQAIPPAQMLSAASTKVVFEELMKQARASQAGVAAMVLLDRPDSNIQATVRVRSGQGEWHDADADILIGLEGSAQIVTGGKLVNGRETAPGEMRGDRVEGGTAQSFGPGDIIRIEPRVAHQMLLAPGTNIRYKAVKVHITR